MTGIALTELNAWLVSQLAHWAEWAGAQDAAWLAIPSGNERFPTTGDLFRHSFTPLHRYSAQAVAMAPPDDSHVSTQDWPALHAWAVAGLEWHRAACEALTGESADELVTFQTRSAGPITARKRMALAHAATHCFWHLGGIAHLLRAQGITPPQRSDLLFWEAQRGA